MLESEGQLMTILSLSSDSGLEFDVVSEDLVEAVCPVALSASGLVFNDIVVRC
jgi:hypothetical protein